MINIQDFISKKSTDCGPGIQAAMDSLADDNPKWPDTSGGKICFPKGRHIVTTPIIIRHPVTILGEGGTSYVCSIDWRGDGSLFTFVSDNNWTAGFRMEDIELRGRKSGTAFRFGSKQKYYRGFQLNNVSIAYFAKAFETTKTAQSWWGHLVCNNCTFHYNGQVVNATKGQLNEFDFNNCILSKNGLESEGWDPQYAFDFFGGDNGSFNRCNLEGQPRVLRVERFHQLRLMGCRFENNATSEDPVVYIKDSSGIYIQAYHRVLQVESKPESPPTILIKNCHDYEVKPMLGKVHFERGWEPRF